MMMRALRPSLLVSVGMALAGCREPATAPTELTVAFIVVVSDPIAAAGTVSGSAAAVSISSFRAASDGKAFVSVATGTNVAATAGIVLNRRTRQSNVAPVVDGGFDPIGIAAAPGDTIDITLAPAVGEPSFARSIVPARKAPRVVRTSPARGRTDVAINSTVAVIFSEPIDPATLDQATVRLLGPGGQVSGTVRAIPHSPVAVEFVPEAPLRPAADYQLVLSRGIADFTGDQLDGELTSAFSTAPAGEPPPPPPPDPVPTGSRSYLVFTRHPSNIPAGTIMPDVVVTARTASHETDLSFNGYVALSLIDWMGRVVWSQAGGGYAVNGVATLNILARLEAQATGYTLVASAPGLESATSAFTVGENPDCNGCWDYNVAPLEVPRVPVRR